MYDIGIMQGRLSPDPEEQFQFFPEDWRAEFPIAKGIGFAGIEWLADRSPNEGTSDPVKIDYKIGAHAWQTGLKVLSVGADWFMYVCPWEGDPKIHREHMWELIVFAANHTVQRVINIPLLERHAIVDLELQQKAIDVFQPLREFLESRGVCIAFETELAAKPLASFVDRFGSANFGVCYDTGNCTSYGFDCSADILFLGNRIKSLHLKDRMRNSSQSVILGEGNTDFVGVFRALRAVGFCGTPVMQAWRGEHYIADAVRQLDFINQKQQEVFND